MSDDWGDDGGDGGDWGDDAQMKGDGEEGGEWENAEFDEDGGAGGGADAGSSSKSGGGGGSAPTPDIAIANLFYEAEDQRREAPAEALKKFQQVVALANKAIAEHQSINEESKTNQFQSIVHIVVLLYHLNQQNASAGGLDEMVNQYKLLLDFIPRVTRNESGDAIDRVLSAIGSSRDFNFLLTCYQITLDRLQQMPDTERMRFNVQMKLCKTYLSKEDYPHAQEVLGTLLKSCQTSTGVDDKKNKGSELLEIYALQIQMSSKRGDSLKMKELYDKTKDLTAAVKDPRSQSVIRECWGQMFGAEGQWQRAYAEFYSAFTHYQEIGNRDKAKSCLKYVVVSNMLSGGEQNPFDAREAKVYQNEPDIAVIGQLRSAYEKCDVDAFGKALDEINQAGDQFIRQKTQPHTFVNANGSLLAGTHLDSMILDFHRRAVLQTLKSYRRCKLAFLAARLKVTPVHVETIVVQLILDGEIAGKIDQVAGVIDLTQRAGGAAKKYAAVEQWTAALERLSHSHAQVALGQY